MANRPIHVVESGGDSTGLKEFADGADSGVQLPSGTTAQRDSSASAGEIRFNTDTKKIEFYDGTQWNSSSKVFVDDSDFKGVFEIASTTYTRNDAGNSSYLNFGFRQDANSSNAFAKFAPDGQDNSYVTHSPVIDNKMGGLGVVGMNHTEADLAKRYSPVLQLTNRPEHEDFNDSNSYYGYGYNMSGAIAFTQRMGPGYNNANANDVLLSAITNEIHQNHADYSGFQIGPQNKMTMHVQNPAIGSFPFLAAGSAWDYGGYSSDAYTSVQISTFLGGYTIPSSNPWANVGTRLFNSYEIGPFRHPNSTNGDTTRITTQEMESIHAHDYRIHSNFITPANSLTGLVIDLVNSPRSGRNGKIWTNVNNYTAGNALQKYIFQIPHSESGYRPAGPTSFEIVFYVSGSAGSNKVVTLPAVTDFQFYFNDYTGEANHNNIYSASTENTTGLIHYDSTMPTSQTNYTITPGGGFSFEIVMDNLGSSSSHFIVKNLQQFL